ncbi:D-serine ammonia-lyase [Alteribacillus sp. JSM 102045]|uniref:D-serine ammonia-lyase n=1 Tax=Alteribacillus sp. JSM 102045 TaxID=1562101 RepID=UPI0035C17D89
MKNVIAGKTLEGWLNAYPLLENLIETEEVFWKNERKQSFDKGKKTLSISLKDINEAEDRFQRFAPYIREVFLETEDTKGIIESPLRAVPKMKKQLEGLYKKSLSGELLLKCDHELAAAGSIKARGGFHEVLKHAETLALKNGFITKNDNYRAFANLEFKELFKNHSIIVGSTGNLGLSIGIIGTALGFRVTVHMSADARQWKKDLLREKGAVVIEHADDYGLAVAEGRKEAEKDPSSYFVDDENSLDLFLGYAVAARRLKTQLDEKNIVINEDRPLFVYLPCGVGGGPGGVAFGLKLLFQDNVHCFFAEPTHSPSMLIGMMTKKHDKLSVQDFGIDNKTAADGLAVGRPSAFVGQMLAPFLSGIYTVSDNYLFLMLRHLADSEKIFLEPSALAGMPGPFKSLDDHGFPIDNAVYIVWATGGSMVPKSEMEDYYNRSLK